MTDIFRRTDLNRLAFYAHYPDVCGVTGEIENKIIAQMMDVLEEFRHTNRFCNPAPLLLKLSRYLEKAKVLTEHMLNDSDLLDDMRHSKMVSLRIGDFAGGIVNLYKRSFRGDLDCTLNDIALEVSKLVQLEAKELF